MLQAINSNIEEITFLNFEFTQIQVLSITPINTHRLRFLFLRIQNDIYLDVINLDNQEKGKKQTKFRSVIFKGPNLYLVFCHCHSHNAYQQYFPPSSGQSYSLNNAKAL